MSYPYRYLLILCALGTVSSAAAQSGRDTTIALPEATVTAQRGRSTRAAAVTRLTTIEVDSEVLEQNTTLADLLDTSTGLYVRRYGPSGSANIAFRGTDPSQTEILLDGLRITDPQSGQVDLSLIPIVLLESVEIVHGAGSSSDASGGLGGTVKLRTLQTEQDGRLRFRAGSGAYGRRNFSGLAGGGRGIVSALVAIERSEEDGAFPYVNNALQPPEWTKRAGADMEATSFFGRASIGGSTHRAAVAGWVNRVERGLPGPSNAAPVSSRQIDEHIRTWINSRHNFAFAAITSDWSIQSARLHYANAIAGTDNVTRTTSLQGKVGADIPAGRAVLLHSGAEWTNDRSGGLDEYRLAISGSAIAETPVLLLETSIRGESWSTESSTLRQVVPRAGLNVLDILDLGLRAKMSIGRTWTVPSLVDRYWVPGGNPDLRPEKGWSAEAGVLLDRDYLEVELTAFSSRLTDRIVWVPSLVGSGVQVWRPINVGEVHSSGIEFSAATHAAIGRGRSVRSGITASYTEAADRSDRAAASFGHQVKYVPRTVVSTTSSLRLGHLQLGFTGQLVGKRYITSDESSSLPSYFVVGGRASYETLHGPLSVTLSVVADNVLNEQYSTVRFYPMPPRHFGFGLNLEWRKAE